MIIKILEIILLFGCIKYTPIFSILKEQNGFIQSTVVVWVQAFSFFIYILLMVISKFIYSKIKVEIKMLNDFYNTNFSVIYLKETGELTSDFERKIRIELKIEYISNLGTTILKKIMNGVSIFLEIDRNDITISSNDKYVIKTQYGVKIPLDEILNSHFEKTNKTKFDIEIYMNIALHNKSYVENNEEVIIYPLILDKQNKKIFFRKIFLKFLSENYRFKLKLEKTDNEE